MKPNKVKGAFIIITMIPMSSRISEIFADALVPIMIVDDETNEWKKIHNQIEVQPFEFIDREPIVWDTFQSYYQPVPKKQTYKSMVPRPVFMHRRMLDSRSGMKGTKIKKRQGKL
jgi:hypothetical protein